MASAAIVGVALLLLPAIGLACPVCFDANDQTRFWYYVTAAGMTALPFVLVATFVGWLVRRSRATAPELGDS